jgi:transposase
MEQRRPAQLESFLLLPWATRRRQELLELLDRLKPIIADLNIAVQEEAERRPEVRRIMTHPGVGPTTALAFVLILGTPKRFQCGKQIGSYVELIPSEASSGGCRSLGHITKQGNTLLRFLLVEAAEATVRCEPEWRRRFTHLALRRDRRIAKIAMARKLAVRMHWMWRKGWDYPQFLKFGSQVGQLETGNGVKQITRRLIGHPAP